MLGHYSPFTLLRTRTLGEDFFIRIVLMECCSHSITTLLRTEFISSIAIPTLWLLISLIIYNLYTALTPLLRPKDELTDIPLTPTQRKLLGLEPTAAPPQTPGTQYITPPRYSHSPTPRLSPATRNNSNYSTPISGSPSFGRERSDSPTGPTSSPLYQKSIGRTREPVRRSSYGSPSPLGPGLGGREGSVMGAPHTPSPTAGRGASVGLNSKWLYNKGRSSSGGRGI